MKHIAAEKPDGASTENWLSIERKDLYMDMILVVCAPDLEKIRTRKAPAAERVK